MIKQEKSIVIRRPIEEVFDYVSDQRNTPQWQSGLVEVRRTTEGPLGVGTKHTFVRNFMGRKMEASNEYVAYEPNKLITFKTTSGPVRLEASYLFEPTAEGTKVTGRIEMEAAGVAQAAHLGLELVDPPRGDDQVERDVRHVAMKCRARRPRLRVGVVARRMTLPDR
jgi:uncharacterized protein YndB with AHSA1/START domain